MARRVAVVTGAHRGLGLGVVRGLCKEFDGDVILTAREDGRGNAAVEELEKEGLTAVFHQLDVTDQDSIVQLRDFLKDNYGGLDVLVNNEGVDLAETTAPFAEQAVEAVRTNYFGTLETSAILFPLLRPHARVCNVSSLLATSTLSKCSPELKAKLTDPEITMEDLSQAMTHFVLLAQDNTHLEEGYPDDAHGFSQIGLTVMSVLQQKELDRQGNEDIIVNGCLLSKAVADVTKCPGILDEEVASPLYCALLPPNTSSPKGAMVRLQEPIDWINFDPSGDAK